MSQRYLKLADVAQRLGIKTDWLETLEAEALIHPKHTLEDDVVISTDDAERIRIIRILTEEMDVNLAGAEVILHMREDMLAMQEQFDEILATLVTELRQRLKP
ncbi:MAG TPA: chaperone modulator CbpM [Candidatus Kryptonia bacterium]|nr:chaperone modulator CbpM [Candidatus Kryptonia bacterium]